MTRVVANDFDWGDTPYRLVEASDDRAVYACLGSRLTFVQNTAGEWELEELDGVAAVHLERAADNRMAVYLTTHAGTIAVEASTLRARVVMSGTAQSRS